MPVDPEHLRATFEPPAPMTVGVEEELMLLDGETLDLAPRAAEVLDVLGGDPRFTRELPAGQLEIVLPPVADASEAALALRDARRDLAAACASLGLRLGGAGVHPFAAPLGELSGGERYERLLADYGDVARAQLVFAQQVHVCVRPADLAMTVYNRLRPWLPVVAALAANAPLHAGRDTGLASVRPLISGLLPRQGIPPALTWETYASALAGLDDPARWWWELRPHPRHGTLEIRVPDTQATVGEAAAVVAVVHALVAWLARAEDASHPPDAPEPWELDEGRFAAVRDGIGGFPHWLPRLFDTLEPISAEQGTSANLATARAMLERGGGAARQRAAFERSGARGAVAELADRFLDD